MSKPQPVPNPIPVAEPSPLVPIEGELPVRFVVYGLSLAGIAGFLAVTFVIFLLVANNFNILNWIE